jgi:hypothetical protein
MQMASITNLFIYIHRIQCIYQYSSLERGLSSSGTFKKGALLKRGEVYSENLTICWCVIIVEITATFHTDELLVSKAVGKCNVPFHIVHFVSVVGMWVSIHVPPT